MTLPPLPEPNVERISGHRAPFVSYDADQMREYGRQCREAALAQAAEVCDNHAFGWEKNPGNNPLAGFIAASNCAGAVRNLK